MNYCIAALFNGSLVFIDGYGGHEPYLPEGSKVLDRIHGTPIEVSYWKMGFRAGRASVSR